MKWLVCFLGLLCCASTHTALASHAQLFSSFHAGPNPQWNQREKLAKNNLINEWIIFMKDGGWACCCLFSLSGAIGACCAHNPPQTKQPQPPFNSIHKRNFISISFVGFHFSLPRSFWLLGAGELIDSIPLRGTLFICFISFHKRRRVCFHSISSIQFLFSLQSHLFIDLFELIHS